MIHFSFLLFSAYITSSLACVTPGPLGPYPDLPLEGIFLAAAPYVEPALQKHEAAIQFRIIQLLQIPIYSTMTAYEEVPLEYFGRVTESTERRRCRDGDEDLFNLHRRVTLAYAKYYNTLFFQPEILDDMATYLTDFGLDPTVCEDGSCDIDTPWGLAYVVNAELYEYSLTDGWNADGSLSRDYNRIPYQDFRAHPYIPSNDPWTLKKESQWQPLLESDELGFLYNQEHVVPHIGQTGKSILIGNEYLCSLTAPDPEYDYDYEMELTLDRLALLTDFEKMQVEMFDDKFSSILPLLGQFYGKQGYEADSWEFIAADTITIAVTYETTLLAWKEKLRWNRVRPTSIIKKRYHNKEITTYAGTTLDGESYGTQTFLGDDFEAYHRTMPHSEYPSGSACLCAAVAESMIEYTGSDDITSIIEGPLIFEVSSFSSIREALSTPSKDIIYEFNSWSEISDICGESRLNGGMHFTASVTEGRKLCKDIGTKIAQAFEKLLNGEQPEYVADIYDDSIFERRCRDDSHSHSSSRRH